MSPRAWAVAAALGVGVLGAPLLWNPALARLNLTLVKLSLLAFGGGFAMIPLIQHDVVARWGWLTTREFIDGIALGQVTPGPIAITATFVGYRVGGLVGAVTATVAAFFPSFVILVAALPHYDRIKRRRTVQWMIRGVLAAFVALLVFVLFQFGRAALVDWTTVTVALLALIALRWRVDLLVIVGVTAIVSVVMF